MLLEKLRIYNLRYVSQACLPVLLVFLLAIAVQAQIGGIDSDPDQGIGSRGAARNTIQGRIHFPSGRMLDRRLKVRIAGATGGELFAMTDESGSFTFRRLAGGTYFITVDAGKDYELTQETVSIIDSSTRSQSGQTVTVQIQLQVKRELGSKPAVVNAALAGVPKPALEIYKKALDAIQEGDSKKALEHLRRAIAVYPEFMLAYNELGVQYLRQNQTDKAVDALRTAVKIAPDSFTPRLNYGTALLQGKQFVEADKEFQRALELKESSPLVHLYRGRALIGMRNFKDAEKELRRAVDLGGDEMSLAHRYLGAIYIERGENEQAIKELEEYLRLMPGAKDSEQIKEIIKGLRANH